MHFFLRGLLPAATLALSLGGLVFPAGRAAAALAQAPPPVAPATGHITVGTALARLSREAGVPVLADASVNVRAPLPAGFSFGPDTGNMPAAALENILDGMVRYGVLPAGTTWTKLYLPAPPPGAPAYEGNDVAALAAAQAKLFGPAGSDVIVLNGRRLSPEKARPLLDSLNLKPVYLVTGGGARPAVGGGADALAALSQLTPVQRDQMSAGILNMNPALRNQMMQQMVSVFMTVMQKMSPEERQQMFAGTPVNPGATGRPDLP